MADLISRSALMAHFKQDEWGTPDERWRPEREFGQMVLNAPAVDAAETGRGEWQDVVETYFGDVYGTCPKCKESFVLSRSFANYCPNCGSRNIGIEAKPSERIEDATD